MAHKPDVTPEDTKFAEKENHGPEDEIVTEKSSGPLKYLWFLTVLLICIQLFLGVGESFISKELYTLDDVVYRQTSVDDVLDVRVDDIRKEKGKEDIYTVTFKSYQGQGHIFKKTMTEGEFELVVGAGNNTVSTKVDILEFLLPTKEKSDKHTTEMYSLSYKRFICFEQSGFTESEVIELASEILTHVNAVQAKTVSTYDAKLLAQESRSELVTLGVLEWDVSLNKGLKSIPQPTEDLEKIKEYSPDNLVHKYVPMLKQGINNI